VRSTPPAGPLPSPAVCDDASADAQPQAAAPGSPGAECPDPESGEADPTERQPTHTEPARPASSPDVETSGTASGDPGGADSPDVTSASSGDRDPGGASGPARAEDSETFEPATATEPAAQPSAAPETAPTLPQGRPAPSSEASSPPCGSTKAATPGAERQRQNAPHGPKQPPAQGRGAQRSDGHGPPRSDAAPPAGPSASPRPGGRPEKPRIWVPRAAGIGCYLIGLLDILSALFPRVRRVAPLRHYGKFVPGIEVDPYAITASLVIGVLLVLMAHGLRRRKHRAWMGTVALLATTVAVHFYRRESYGGAALAIIFLIVLVCYWREFYALSDPRSRWRAIWTFIALAIGDVVLGLILVSARSRALIGAPSIAARVEHVILGLAGISGPLAFTEDRYSDVVYFSLFGLGLLTIMVTLYLFLRPAEPVGRLTGAQEQQVRGLLARHGHRDSLGYFALRRDKSVLFSATGKACIGFRVVSGVMLASGDPVGDPEAWPGAIHAFIERAERYAWIPAVVGCSEQGGEVWQREAGMDALELGDEAVVEVADFSLEGRAMRNVRQMVNRIERQGYVCQVRRLRDIPPDQIASIGRLARDGRSTQTERGFSMALGRFGDPADIECMVVTAVKDDEIRAVLNFVPWGGDGLSLDLMRRDRTADPGLNELMIVAALREAPRLGIVRISLNFAVFRSALERGERIGAGPVLRRWRGLLIFMSRWFQIESLYRFNAKFRPIWEPRFVAFRQTRDLPRIALAALEAEAFVVLPSMLRRGPKEPPEPAALRD
jgi:lysyl-tRNA synthetase, class II